MALNIILPELFGWIELCKQCRPKSDAVEFKVEHFSYRCVCVMCVREHLRKQTAVS